MDTKIAYINPDQLSFLLEGKKDIVDGFSFEWNDEGVFHLYSRDSKLTPIGVPSLCRFILIREEKSDSELLEIFEDELKGLQDENAAKTFGVVFVFVEDKIVNQYFYKNINGTVEKIDLNVIPSKAELYSRNKGILEIGILDSKNVAIIGLGSFGSPIAIELAKAGVGSFELFDFDRVELHNLSRHISGINELGRLKTNAVRDAILLKNPYANVNLHPINIVEDTSCFEDVISRSDIVICATDNNHSRFIISNTATKLGKTVIYGKAITRAAGGDIFIQRENQPCYLCLFENDFYNKAEEITNENDSNIPAYGDASSMVQVGLSADVNPIWNMMVKLVLVELSKGLNSGISSLEEELSYNYYFWVNRREDIYSGLSPFYEGVSKPTILRWYGIHIPNRSDCMCATL